MGCISGKSKIPAQKPGQILMNSGIPEFDKVFSKCEAPLKVIEDSRTALDLLTTDFVRSLGAEKHWEINPNLKDLMKMVLSVLSASGKGNLEAVGVSYTSEPPYLLVNRNALSKGTRKMMDYFYELVKGMSELEGKLDPIIEKVNKAANQVKDFPSKVAQRAEELEFNMKDKLAAVSNTNKSCKRIMDAPGQITELLRVSEESKHNITQACDQAQIPPHSDRIISRGVQAASEGLKRPADIVNKFWPVN